MPNWIGDLVMATPVLEDLRANNPGCFIAALVCEKLEDLLVDNPYIDAVIPICRRRFFPRDSYGNSIISLLRKERFDEGYLLTNSLSTAYIFWIGRVKKRVGFFWSLRSLFLTENIPFPKERKKIHLVDTYKTLIKSLSDSTPSLFIQPEKREGGKLLIGINPGAAYGNAKCYLPERFKEVARRLIEEIPNVEVLFFGDHNSKKLVGEICQGLPSSVKNLAGKTTLYDLMKKIVSLDVLLTNDSGPMHIAAAVKTPLVALFGSTSDKVTGPYKWGHVINKRVSCSPCYHRVCPIDFKCMKEIQVSEVVQEIKKALLKKIVIAPKMSGTLREPHFITSSASVGTQKKVGTIIMAAGMGRRFGIQRPKGLLEVGGKTLYETLIARAGERVAIMTSPATHKETLKYLNEKGLDHVGLFQSRCFPRLTVSYEETPEGNGALFSTFYHSPLFEKWNDVELISIIPIDNPLADPLDPEMLSQCDDLIVKAVRRQEKMGALVEVEGKLHVIEYSEMDPKDQWNLGYTGMFVCSKSFFEKAACHEMPWHIVEKNDGRHYEKFVFDAFPLANSYKILERDPKICFFPIKTKADLVAIEKNLYNVTQNSG